MRYLGLPTLEHCVNKAHEAVEQSLSRHLLPKGFLRAHNASGYNDRNFAIGTDYWLFLGPFKILNIEILYRK